MINKVILLGNVGMDAVSIPTKNNMPMARFSLATNEFIKDSSGQSTKVTEWHEIVTFGKTASFVLNYVRKGKLVLVEGKLASREYVNKSGEKVKSFQIKADSVQFAGPAPREKEVPTEPKSTDAPISIEQAAVNNPFSVPDTKQSPVAFSYQGKTSMLDVMIEEDLKLSK